MARRNRALTVAVEQIEQQIYIVRGVRVMLDSDLAALYEVPTKVFNQAMRRKAGHFPEDFAFQLTEQEFTNLRSQTVTSSSRHGGRRYRPWAFTEHGVAMLSSVLESPRAVRVNIEIIRVFVRLRRLLATPGELVAQLTQLAETVKLHDDQIKVIVEALRRMMAPPPPPTGRRIGFETPQPSSDGPEQTSPEGQEPLP
jgi:hypothetical protein